MERLNTRRLSLQRTALASNLGLSNLGMRMMTDRSTSRRAFRFTALATLFAFGAACGPFHTGSPDQRARLIFSNESLDQADVYAAGSDGFPVRVGTVFAGRTDTLSLPESVANQGGSVNIFARLFARSGVPQSGQVYVRPGDQLYVRLTSDEKFLVVLPP
jgi:hypothetical protein